MKNKLRSLFAAATVSLVLLSCGSNEKSEHSTDSMETESNVGDTAVVLDNDSIANPPTVVDSLK